jgi:hypothetical protein
VLGPRPGDSPARSQPLLRKSGRLLCVEHILGKRGSALELQHNLLNPLQIQLADGCHLNRQTDLLLCPIAVLARAGELLSRRVSQFWHSVADMQASRRLVVALEK